MTFTFTRIANTDTPLPEGNDNFDRFGFLTSETPTSEPNITELLWPAINENGDIAFYANYGEISEGIEAGIYLYSSSNEVISTIVDNS